MYIYIALLSFVVCLLSGWIIFAAVAVQSFWTAVGTLAMTMFYLIVSSGFIMRHRHDSVIQPEEEEVEGEEADTQ